MKLQTNANNVQSSFTLYSTSYLRMKQLQTSANIIHVATYVRMYVIVLMVVFASDLCTQQIQKYKPKCTLFMQLRIFTFKA